MKQKIYNLTNVYQGSILTRIKTHDASSQPFEAITMQELSFYCNDTDDLPIKNFVQINKDKLLDYQTTKENDVIVGVSSGKAMVIGKDRANKLVLSNFAIIRIKDINVLDPHYLCWIINENNDFKRQLFLRFQKTARVLAIPLSTLKDIDIEICDIETQRKIGIVYDLSRRLTRLKRQKAWYLDRLINYYLDDLNERKQ